MNDDAAMRLALAEGERALGRTRPNPPVGCVIVRGDAVLGVGHTQPPGQAHAEIMALRDAEARGHDVRGATMVVTLEPCCHHGRTPPCTDAILAAGLGRVVVGCMDPFELVAGKGIGQLRAGGVEVEVGVLAEACAASVQGFVRATMTGLPSVTLKVAVSLDGNLAAADGTSMWITSEAARADAHALRGRHDAVLVGIGTALADDPRLTARGGTGGEPRPVVLDSALRLPTTAKLLQGPQRAIVVCALDVAARAADADGAWAGAELVGVPRGPGGLDLRAALRALAARGLHRVLVEGGALVARSVIDQGLADELVLYAAPTALPGGRSWLGGPPVATLADAPRWRLVDTTVLGPDVALRYQLRAVEVP